MFCDTHSYKILAPKAVDAAKDPKSAAAAVLDEVALDNELYRLGNTKACIPPIILIDPSFQLRIFHFMSTSLNVSFRLCLKLQHNPTLYSRLQSYVHVVDACNYFALATIQLSAEKIL